VLAGDDFENLPVDEFEPIHPRAAARLFGDGSAGEKIARHLVESLEGATAPESDKPRFRFGTLDDGRRRWNP
jgi:hypothetical protein